MYCSGFVETREIEIRPVDSWQESNRIDFIVPRYSGSLFEANSFKVHFLSRIVHIDGTKIDDSKYSYSTCDCPAISAFE